MGGIGSDSFMTDIITMMLTCSILGVQSPPEPHIIVGEERTPADVILGKSNSGLTKFL